MESKTSEFWLIAPREPVSQFLRQLLPTHATCRIENAFNPELQVIGDRDFVGIDLKTPFSLPESTSQVLAEQKWVSPSLRAVVQWVEAMRRAEVRVPLIVLALREDALTADEEAQVLSAGATEVLVVDDLSAEDIERALRRAQARCGALRVQLRRDAIDSALCTTAQRFLRAHWLLNIDDTLASLGRAVDVSHACLCQLETSAAIAHQIESIESAESGRRDELKSRLLHDWALPDFTPLHQSDLMMHMMRDGVISETYARRMNAGEVVECHAGDSSSDECHLPQAAGVRSWLTVPITVEGELWGFWGFGEARENRHWHRMEIEALQRASELLAAAIAHERSDVAREDNAEALRAAMRFNEEVISTAGEGIAVFDTELKFRLWNQFLERMTGLTEEQVTSFTVEQIFPNASEIGMTNLMQRALQGESTQSGDVEFFIHTTGKHGWISCVFEPHRDGKGDIVGIISVVSDVSERHFAEEKLRRSSEKFRSLIENGSDIICAFDFHGVISYVSPALERAVNSEPMGLQGHLLWNYLHPEDSERVRYYIAHVLENSNNISEFEMRLRNGEGRWQTFEASCRNLLDDEAVGGLVINARDISQRKENERALIRAAMHDRLTGLPNRTFFMDRLRLRIERARRSQEALYAVLFLDFDRFKVINDSLGHLVGDQLLIAIGQRLETCLRPGDTVARLGGDEFAILLEDMVRVEDALDVAERVQREMRRPFTLERDSGAEENSHYEVFTAASIGIALAGMGNSAPAYERPEDLLRDADLAMYRAKERGRGRHEIFDVAMHQHAMARLKLETELRAAIENGALQVHYQPIVTLETGILNGFEALLRWQHPERGWLPPSEFLEVAEETGLIIPLGWWVLREACLQLRHWMNQLPTQSGQPRILTMNVNLSNRQFTHPDLLSHLEEALEEADLQAQHLKLEINESVLATQNDTVERHLKALHEMGVRLGLDDFGTGYSSLSQLHRFHIGALKIDSSFIAELTKNDGWSMAQTIVSLARQLKIDVVAEGIETREQAEHLRNLECGSGQGFYFAPPMSQDDAAHFLNTYDHTPHHVLES